MAANRKLQGEIDRTLKKVQEGVELFDEVGVSPGPAAPSSTPFAVARLRPWSCCCSGRTPRAAPRSYG